MTQTFAPAAQSKNLKARDEGRRERGELSCAECRRLKLKCNKKIPCSSCVKRGCHTICPNGSLASGQGTRRVLANTYVLHQKLSDMSKRIRMLEEALNSAHSILSQNTDPHPLLVDELLSIKLGVDLPGDTKENIQDKVAELALSLDTLVISQGGRPLPIENVDSEVLVMDRCGWATNGSIPIKDETPVFSSLPRELKHTATDFQSSISGSSRRKIRKLIRHHLPSYDRATSLINLYFKNLAWFCRPAQRSQVIGELLPALYEQEWVDGPEDNVEGFEESPGMHQLALAMTILACAVIIDLSLSTYNPEAVLYHRLARLALSSRSIFEETCYETIQTIILLSKFEFFILKNSSQESAWKLMSLGLVLAKNIGLHRDPSRYGLDQKAIQRRRYLFWEIFSVDKVKSLGSGRPSIFHLDEIDCATPEEAVINLEEGSEQAKFRTWKYRFAKEIIGPTSEFLAKVQPVKYAGVLELDRKIREFPDFEFSEYLENKSEFNPRILMWSSWKEILLLYLHRNFFAKALIDESDSPLRSGFAPSFLAAYSTSISYLKNARRAYAHCPRLVDRQWNFWAHCLIAAVMIGSVACRTNPSLAAFTAAARDELLVSVETLQKVASHPVVAAGLPILLRLRNKAFLLAAQHCEAPSHQRLIKLCDEDDVDENCERSILPDEGKLCEADMADWRKHKPRSAIRHKRNPVLEPVDSSSAKNARSPVTKASETCMLFNASLNSPSIFVNAEDTSGLAQDSSNLWEASNNSGLGLTPSQTPSLNLDAWPQLDLYTILSGINPGPMLPTPRSGESSAGISSPLSGETPSLLSSATQGSGTDLIAECGYPDLMPNTSISTLSPNNILGIDPIARREQNDTGRTELGELPMDIGENALIDTWRFIIDSPDFMGFGRTNG